MNLLLPIGLGAAALGLLFLSGSDANAAEEEHHPLDPPYGGNTGPVTLPEVIIHGDPKAALGWQPETLAAAQAVAEYLDPNADNCWRARPVNADLVRIFQATYSADPNSGHSENMLGTPGVPVFGLDVDGLVGPQTAMALFYVLGEQFPTLSC